MIAPDDQRHGTTRGFHAGCRKLCCRRALARDEKKRRLDKLRGGRAIPALGAQRRIQALMCLGWTSTDIAHAAGWPERNYVLRILKGQKGKPTRWLERKTHDAICDVYDRLSMRLPEIDSVRARTRSIAARKGFVPPLAWDDIDDPDERPKVGTTPRWRSKDDVDHAVVARVVNGERLPMTRAERVEVVRRLRDDWGWSEERIEHHTGIAKATNRNRYPTRPQEGAA